MAGKYSDERERELVPGLSLATTRQDTAASRLKRGYDQQLARFRSPLELLGQSSLISDKMTDYEEHESLEVAA